MEKQGDEMLSHGEEWIGKQQSCKGIAKCGVDELRNGMAEIGYAEEEKGIDERWNGIESISHEPRRKGMEPIGMAKELNWSDTHRSCPDWH